MHVGFKKSKIQIKTEYNYCKTHFLRHFYDKRAKKNTGFLDYLEPKNMWDVFCVRKKIISYCHKMKYKFVASGLFLLARNYTFYALKNE